MGCFQFQSLKSLTNFRQSSASINSQNNKETDSKKFQKQKRTIECNNKFVPQKRKASSDKERQRNLEIKAVLNKLSDFMPYVKKKSLSRIRTLRLSSEYIKHLIRILQGATVFFFVLIQSKIFYFIYFKIKITILIIKYLNQSLFLKSNL